MQELRAQGLCYNCDEKFIDGHRCGPNCFLLLLMEEEIPSLEDHSQPIEEESTEPKVADTYFQLSPLAVGG